MPVRLVFSYLAFSTPQQKKGRSSDRQDTAAENWAKANGFRLAPERQYRDEGLSRYNGEARMKGALSRFIRLCGTPAVPAGSILIIEDFDRLSRECPDDAWELFRLILLADVEIVVLSLGRWFKRESLNDLGDRVLVQCSQHRAHQESAMKAKRVADIWADRRRRAAAGKGIQTRLPSWVERNAVGDLVLIPERAAVIRRMVQLVLSGMGTRRIAGALTSGPDAAPCWLQRGEWDSECIQQILKRPAVWGAYQPQRMNERRQLVPVGDLVRGHYPAVLTEEEAAAVRRMLASRCVQRGRPIKRNRSILTKLVRDAETGQNLRMKETSGAVHRDYLDRRWQGRSQIIAPYPILEALVLRAVHQWTPDALTPRDAVGDRQLRQDYLKQLGAVAADREAIRAELSRPGRAASTAAILAGQLDDLAKREAELTQAVADLDEVAGGVSPARLKACQSLASRYIGLSPAEKEAAAPQLNSELRDILDGVWVYRRRLTARTAELIVQIWPRAGAAKECRVFLGKPPDDYRPLDVGDVDFRRGFPVPFPGGSVAKKSPA